MKKLISICFLIFFAVTGNAQVNKKTNISELNQDQLNLALAKSLKTIKAGEISTGVGIVLGITGGVLLLDDMDKRNRKTGPFSNLPTGETAAGELILVGGIAATGIGITKWTIGLKQKTKIEMELVKFKGSASINGVGLKIWF